MSRLRTCGALSLLHNTPSRSGVDVQGQTTLPSFVYTKIRKKEIYKKGQRYYEGNKKEIEEKVVMFLRNIG
jgi:hypothetical protein